HQIPLGALGGDYTWQAVPVPSPDEARKRVEWAQRGYYPTLQKLRIGDMSDRAMHELLDLCRANGISVALLLTPEGSAFQSWYSPEAGRCVDDYCAALSQEYGVPLVDGRDWLDDGDFADSHQVNLRGAEAFTLRLGRDVLQPLVEGKLR